LESALASYKLIAIRAKNISAYIGFVGKALEVKDDSRREELLNVALKAMASSPEIDGRVPRIIEMITRVYPKAVDYFIDWKRRALPDSRVVRNEASIEYAQTSGQADLSEKNLRRVEAVVRLMALAQQKDDQREYDKLSRTLTSLIKNSPEAFRDQLVAHAMELKERLSSDIGALDPAKEADAQQILAIRFRQLSNKEATQQSLLAAERSISDVLRFHPQFAEMVTGRFQEREYDVKTPELRGILSNKISPAPAVTSAVSVGKGVGISRSQDGQATEPGVFSLG